MLELPLEITINFPRNREGYSNRLKIIKNVGIPIFFLAKFIRQYL